MFLVGALQGKEDIEAFVRVIDHHASTAGVPRVELMEHYPRWEAA